MRVVFGTKPNGDHYATTVVPVLGGTVRLVAVVTDRELREMYRSHLAATNQQVGFKLSLKSLGGALKAISKPATLLKITTMAARLSVGDPTALLQAPGLISDVKRGMAAKRVMAAAAEGNPKAQAVVRAARAAAAEPSAPVPVVPGIDAGVMKYLVTVQRLAQAN
jgi:hypothetical protein